MSASIGGNIRLATGGDRNSILYNAYHLITQMAAFYGNVSQQTRPKFEQAVFTRLSDAVIKDLGELYIAWESLDKTNIIPLTQGEALARRVTHTCGQFSKIMHGANEWTPFLKMLALVVLIEKRWIRILKSLTQGAGKEAAVLAGLIAAAEGRSRLVTADLHQKRLAGRLTQDAFDAADQSLLDKSFGF